MNKTIFYLSSAAMLLAASPSFSQTNTGIGAVAPDTQSPAERNPTETPSPASIAAQSKIGPTDRNFIDKATIGGMAEVQAGRLAQSQTLTPRIRQFGQHMVADHTEAGDKLKVIVDAERVNAPHDLDTASNEQLASLQKLKDKAFDREYARQELAAHKDTIALFQTEITSGTDPKLKNFATATLPTLKQHLTDIQSIAVTD